MNPLPCLLAVALGVFAGTAAFSQPFGLTNRVANTTLRLPPSPPVFGYTTTNAFGNLTFANPVAVVTPFGETNRVFVVEQGGRVAVITNLTAPTRTVFLDVSAQIVGGTPNDERGLLGMAFHPGYASNRLFYVYYSLSTTTPAGAGLHQRVSRFEASPTNPDQALPGSEQVLLTMRDEANNHNGGCLQFGADGYLYVSLGDEGDQNDTRNNTQIIDKDFWASILRLDVDQRPGNLVPNPHPAIASGATNYLVPADNPFVGVTSWYGSNLLPTKVRTEMYAIGLRNPWRFSFDPPTGLLYCGDVGQGAWEEIDLIVKGGNYGWAFREGTNAGPKAAPPGAVRVEPIQVYGHGSATNQGNSVTGGVVYRGNRIPDLFGWYVFSDYVSGNLWALKYDGTNTTPFRRLTGNTSVAGFGIDPANGDVLLADQGTDSIKRLMYVITAGGTLPATLADAGVFADVASLTPQAGIVPYDINLPSWTDGAVERRWFSVPNPALQITFRATNNYTFPTGTVWVQHFELAMTNGVPESRRRLETRLLVRDSASGVYGFSYRWGDSLTDAALVPDSGLNESFVIEDGGGILRTQVWRYPGRLECLVCHTPPTQGGLALGFNTPQLNRDFDYGGVVDNQLRSFANVGYFSSPPTNIFALRSLPALTNEAWSVESRVRAYFAANCASCHLPGGPGRGNFDARPYRATSVSGFIDGLLFENFGNPSNRVIVSGSFSNSMIRTRLMASGIGRMPPLGSSVLDSQAIALVSRWITNELPAGVSFTNWQLLHFGSTNAPDALASADPDGDRARNYLEWLTSTGPSNALDFWQAKLIRTGAVASVTYPRLAGRGFEVEWTTNLFNSNSWQALSMPQNRPFFAATNGTGIVPDTITNGPARFYRVRVYEP